MVPYLEYKYVEVDERFLYLGCYLYCFKIKLSSVRIVQPHHGAIQFFFKPYPLQTFLWSRPEFDGMYQEVNSRVKSIRRGS